jgi:DNA-directed RNA polymerase specialized sigma24 family protein
MGEGGWQVAETVDFEAFCVAENTALIRMLTLYCGDREVAQDLAQETLARAWVHWRRVRGMDRGDLWLRRVALNLAKSHFRHTKVERSARTRMLWADERVDSPEAAERLAVRGRGTRPPRWGDRGRRGGRFRRSHITAGE